MSPVPSRRRLLPFVLAAALAVPLVQAVGSATPAAAAGELLSQNRPVTVSSTESAAFPGSAAVDGDAGTRWSSGFADPQWIQVDLGATATIDEVRLSWEAAYGRAFTVQVSGDASSWSTVYSTTTSAGGDQVLPVTGTGRYVRLHLTTRATQYGYSLWEFQVFGTVDGGGPDPGQGGLLSYRKPATASTFQDDGACGGCTPDKATDLDPATRWATSSTDGWVDPGWITVDLGATATIDTVVLQWDPAYAVSYELQVSDDNATWRTVHSTTEGGGFKETVSVSGTGRYVRMYGTERSNGYGYSLWEFQVYGTGGAPTPPPPAPPAPDFDRLVWSDEFNGPNGATPDPAKWTPETGPGVNNELQYYTDNENARMDGAGNLVIQARREVTPGSACPPDPNSGGSTTCQYTSGRITTAGKFETTYGRVEARIKVSSTPGLWPAFWMLGANFFDGVPWPASGEIDIMEHIGREPNLVHSTLHAPAYFGAGGEGAALDLGEPANAAFHVFAVEWDAEHLTFFVDGNPFHTVDRDTLEQTRGPWVFDHPFFLILNNAVGGDWPGPPGPGTVLPQDMLIDYVRVYR
ncbi:discoidin domain-containing protein [Actinophytocola gossypii]|uniref:Discoidin domain-containing protein n=1 Tax=Actinophytocola gossypii TaxID=2812003 RepID=A0ABT2JIE6_9PSEU|nr:discoidin domain-containing protein [Actinophytocola gossypii]MCT2587663.1 discoidin domain-containing protein [Actinophytocola gossypii]